MNDNADNNNPSGDTKTQVITLLGGDNSNSHKIMSKDVEIRSTRANNQNRTMASNKIQVNKIVSFDWEQKYYYGNIVAVHRSGEYFAYSLRPKSDGVVRVFHKKSNERELLKGFKGKVVDLSFAYYDEILLGCVDETANAYIYRITLDSASKIKTTLLLNVSSNSQTGSPSPLDSSQLTETHRFIWCLYIPDSTTAAGGNQEKEKNIAEDASKVFVVTNNKRADIYHLDLLTQNYDTSKLLNANDLKHGHFCINEHQSTITTAAFSPDGSAIATASLDGDVYFFKISFNENELSDCLTKWQPHGNKPITTLFFLDDHKNSSVDAQFWSFIVTGCEYNRELKIWCCVEWQCLQTITFTTDDDLLPIIKSAIDLSSTYLVLSDITRKVFYVLHLVNDVGTSVAHAYEISEFSLASPALSYAILDATKAKNKTFSKMPQSSSTSSANHDAASSANGGGTAAATGSGSASNADSEEFDSVMLQLYCIQTKQLQEMNIFVNCPESSTSITTNLIANNRLSSSVSFNSDLKDRLSDVLSDLEQDLNSSRNNINSSASNKMPQLLPITTSSTTTIGSSNNYTSNGVQPVLLTPDAFSNTPRRINNETMKSNDVIQSFMSNSSRASSLTHVTSCINAPTTNVNNNNSNSTNGNVNQLATIASVNSTNVTPSSTMVYNLQQQQQQSSTNTTPKNENNDEIERKLHHLSSSSSSSTSSTSSDSSSDSSSEAADKEIEAISLPNRITHEQQQQQQKSPQIRPITPVHQTSSSVTNLLLNKVDIDFDNELDGDKIVSSKKQSLTTNNQQRHKFEILETPSLDNEPKIEKGLRVKDTPLTQSAILNELTHNPNPLNPWPNPPLVSSNNKLKNTSSNESVQQKPSNVDLTNQNAILIEIMNLLRSQQSEIEMLKKQQVAIKTHIDNSFDMMSIRAQKQQMSQSTIINDESLGSIAGQLMPKLEKVVKDEIRQTIQPQVLKIVEPFKEQLPNELAEKLKATENVLKDSIVKLFKSKSLLDTINQTVTNAVQSSVVNNYRDAFQKLIIPNFEKSTQNMFQQINAAFKKGTDDYIQEFDNFYKQQRKLSEEQKDPIINQLKQYNDNLQTFSQQLNQSITNSIQMQDQNLHNSNAILQDTIISSVKAIIKEELNVAMRDQQQHLPERLITLMRQSGTMTPVTYAADVTNVQETQSRMMALLQKGQLNSAFQLALCAADLNLLMILCETVNPSQVFEQKPCPLQQPVLLSLIQQLSQELSVHTETKLKYLEEALMNLDQSNALTREHMPSVINVLMQKLTLFIQAHPNDKITKQMRMLLMASQSLLIKQV